MRGPRGLPIDVVPSSRPINRASAAPPDPSPCLEREGTRQGLRHAVFGAIRGPVTRPRLWRPCSTKTSTCAANVRCVAFWPPKCQFEERRAQRSHPEYQKPELMATAPGPGLVLGYHTAAGAEEVELLTTSTSSWTSSAATSWDGWWRIGRARPWPGAVDPAELPEAWRPAPGP